MRILITGGAGYIGSHLIEELIKYHKLFVVDNLSTGFESLILKKIKFYKLDIRKTLKIKNIIEKEKIDTIIHLAAKLSLQEARKKPRQYFVNNVVGTESILKAIENSKVKTFIFSSTAAVYSGNNVIGCRESLVPNPTNLYGKTKFLAEKMIKSFCRKKKIKYFILRYFNVVGASKSGKIGPIKDYGQLFKILSKISLRKNPIIKIYGKNHKTKDGSCIRDFIDINDLVYIHKFLLNNHNKFKFGKILNCGYGKGYSVLEIIHMFEKVINRRINIKVLKKRKGEISNIYANNYLLKKKLNWKPKYQNMILSIKRCFKLEKKINNV